LTFVGSDKYNTIQKFIALSTIYNTHLWSAEKINSHSRSTKNKQLTKEY